jgi:hypothetical protein
MPNKRMRRGVTKDMMLLSLLKIGRKQPSSVCAGVYPDWINFELSIEKPVVGVSVGNLTILAGMNSAIAFATSIILASKLRML